MFRSICSKALPQAVAAMHDYMVQRQQAFEAQLHQRLEGTLAELQRLQGPKCSSLSWTQPNN